MGHINQGARETGYFVTSYLYLVQSSTSILGGSCLKKCLENIKYCSSRRNQSNQSLFSLPTVIAYCPLGQESKSILLSIDTSRVSSHSLCSHCMLRIYFLRSVESESNMMRITFLFLLEVSLVCHSKEAMMNWSWGGGRGCILHILSQMRLPNNKVGCLRIGYQLS